MANIETAIGMVVDYIISCGLYSFKSLSDDTQKRLKGTYGKDFGKKVDAQLSL